MSSSAMRSVLESDWQVCLGASSELTWERAVKLAGSVSLRAIGSVVESMIGSVLGNILRAYL
jgi:hypothetical protein